MILGERLHPWRPILRSIPVDTGRKLNVLCTFSLRMCLRGFNIRSTLLSMFKIAFILIHCFHYLKYVASVKSKTRFASIFKVGLLPLKPNWTCFYTKVQLVFKIAFCWYKKQTVSMMAKSEFVFILQVHCFHYSQSYTWFDAYCLIFF